MVEERLFRRGDVVLAAMPLVTNPSEAKIRPAVIVQNDVGNRFSANLIVANVTSELPRRQYPTNLMLRMGSTVADGAGLERDSTVQAEVISTIPKSAVIRRLGHLSASALRSLDECLKVSLALN